MRMRGLHKNESLFVAGLVLLITGICTLWLISEASVWMIVVGILVAAFAINVRVISPFAAFTLAAYLFVHVCVLAFKLLAGIDDFGVNWLDHVSWFCRVVGVLIALSLIAYLWFMVHMRRKVYSELQSDHPPSDLPAAAVSELVDGDDGYRTPLTIVLEMLQKGTLEIISVGEGPAQLRTYQLAAGLGRRYQWEQTVSEEATHEPTTRLALLKRINDSELGVRRQIRDYLEHRSLLVSERSIRTQKTWTAILAILGSVLMSAGLALWIVSLGLAWAVGLSMVGVAYVGAAWIACRQNAKLNKFTAAGRTEIMQWRGYATHLESSALDEDQAADFEAINSLMPYAAALKLIHLSKPETQMVVHEQPSELGAAFATSSRGDRIASEVGFFTGFYFGSYIYPGEGIAESILDLSDFSAVFGGFGGGAGGDGGGDIGGDGGGGDFGGGGGGDFDISI